MAKSLRTAFIRVSRENNTEKGVVIFEKEDIQKILDDWLCSTFFEYFYIEHSEDDECSNVHFHIVIKFKNPYPFVYIKSRFPFGNIEPARNIKACVQYLVHLNSPDKKQYSWEEIKTNVKDITKYKIKTNEQSEIDINGILERIDRGEIREYNQYSEISITLYSKYRSRIENALLYYKERACMDKNRLITVVFCEGDTGTGKTTFAKELCEKRGLSYSITSSSNDPLQDYKGEDVLIMDDLRDIEFTFTDLLKILDNHTKSSMKSRYHNKAFIGLMIIITSYKPLESWYSNIDARALQQLYRRIQHLYKFTTDAIYAYQYINQSYVLTGKSINKYYIKKKEILQESINLAEGVLEFKKIDDTEYHQEIIEQEMLEECKKLFPKKI